MSYTKTQWNNDTAPAINEDNLNKIEQGIYDNDSHIGDLSDLETTANTDLVSAINENVSSIGDLSDLETTTQTDIVSAINELDNLKATKDVATTALNGLMSSVDKGSLDSIFGIPVDTVTDLNQVYEGSFKFGTNTANAPTTISGKVLAFKLTSNDYRYQIVMHDYTLSMYIRYRYYYNSQWIWSSWYSLATTTYVDDAGKTLGCKELGEKKNNFNLNDLHVGECCWWSSGSANNPVNAPMNGGRAYCFKGYASSNVIQIAFGYDSNNIWIRHFWSTWSSWRTI